MIKKITKYIFTLFIILLLLGCSKSTKKGDGTTITLIYNNGYEDIECITDTGYFNCDYKEPIRKGYTFKGWVTECNEEKDLTELFSNSTILYGVWEANTYNITFILNNGTNNVYDELEVKYNDKLPIIEKDIPTRDGYRFMGWYDNKNHSKGKEYYDDNNTGIGKYKNDNNTILYASWVSDDEITYTISFDLNGGSGQVPNNVLASYDFGMPNIGENKPIKPGYEFIGWYDDKEYSKGKQYYNSNNLSVTKYDKKKDITLYAGWKKEKYKVKFDLNGGTGNLPSSFEISPNSTLPSINSSPKKTGYEFLGWYDSKQNGTKYYNSSGKAIRLFDKTKDTTLYAGWKANVYIVSFNTNEGSGAIPPDINISYNGTLPNISSNPTKIGYEFLGWYDNKNYLNGTKYYSSNGVPVKQYDKTESIVLYAGWKIRTFTVKYSLNGGSGNTPSQITVKYNGTLDPIVESSPTRKGYTFLGWYDNNNYLNGTKYYTTNGTPLKEYDKLTNSTMYAGWSGKSYTVSFNTNGGYGETPSNVTATMGKAMPTIQSLNLLKIGYTFTGWYDDNGTKYYNADGTSAKTFDKASNTTLRAGYQQKIFLSGTSLSNFKEENNINRSSNYVVFNEVHNVNGSKFTIYYVYDKNTFTQDDYVTYINYSNECLSYMGKIDSSVLSKIKNTGASIVFLGSYLCDAGSVNNSGYTFSAYCNSNNRNLVMGYERSRYGNAYYYNSLVHESGHAYDFTLRYNILHETGHGITGLTLNNIINGYTNSSGLYISPSNIKPLFYSDSNNQYYPWSELSLNYAEVLKNRVSGFSYYSVEDLKNRPLEFYAEVFRAYYESPSKRRQLYNAAPIVYDALEKTLQYY